MVEAHVISVPSVCVWLARRASSTTTAHLVRRAQVPDDDGLLLARDREVAPVERERDALDEPVVAQPLEVDVPVDVEDLRAR